MRLQQQIQVNELLLEREALFVRIHELEQQVEGLLGGKYPFERPRLPSDQKVRKKPGATRPNASAKTTVSLKLEAGECGYVVTYRQGGCLKTEWHVQAQALETFQAAQTAGVMLVRIQTADAQGAPVRLLMEYPQETAGSPETPTRSAATGV